MLRDVRYRLLALAGLLMLLTACGKPPDPPLSGPPGGPVSAGSASALPSGFTAPQPVPTGLPPGALPTLPPLPYVPPTTLPPVTTTTPQTTTPASTVSPAPKCGGGPTTAQMLAVLEGLPGIPEQKLAVAEGPFCSGSWQFATVQIAGEDSKDAEQIFVVTTGTPTALKVIEAGTDVCSVEVQTKAPAGIRVRACGA
ncbi:hypothetical protein DMB66_43690 [Actinoplanes sp. ATCC 53533]|uniref:hypothetical protein n=1 Tax=Actinoplanes sp. ATCC 53533 TaxID=1288362 RepID=UPI000F7B7493|nr:hypothetical protein [Actinoplanes sp. ATCC 53533]RSM50384.1 hypothetical protein DMB66_43690 [Actinoplanes sp. ATCC 53533]